MNPSLVLGPLFTRHGGTSEVTLAEIMTGAFVGVLDTEFPFVDVRDVAETHFRVMFNEGTNGKRFISAADPISMSDIVESLKKEFASLGYDVPNQKITYKDILTSGSPFAKNYGGLLAIPHPIMSNERSVKELELKYRAISETAVDMGHSLLKFGVLPSKA